MSCDPHTLISSHPHTLTDQFLGGAGGTEGTYSESEVRGHHSVHQNSKGQSSPRQHYITPAHPHTLTLTRQQKLLELNNLHSLTAVVSALQSTAIFRLAQTWKCVGKRDRVVYERLQDFVSEKDNWSDLASNTLSSIILPVHVYVYPKRVCVFEPFCDFCREFLFPHQL